MASGTVVFMRHGETEWNRTGRMQGWAPVPLNDRGREQATVAGRHLRAAYEIDRIVASDLERTRETTAIVRDHVDAPVTFESGWRERHMGRTQGLLAEELFERYPELSLTEDGIAATERAPDEGESFVEMRDRVLEAWTRLRESVDDETVLVIAHGGSIKLTLGALKGLDIPASVLEQDQSNCAITELRLADDTLVRENETQY